jgi:hypothetical protein
LATIESPTSSPELEKTLACATSTAHGVTFFRDRRRAFAALEFTNEKIEEAENTLDLLKWKKEQLEEYMREEGYMH